MIKVIFKNVEKSKLAESIVESKLAEAVDKFPDLAHHKLQATLFAENKPSQPGPDLFGIKLIVRGKKFYNLVLEKKASTLYQAVAELCEGLLERLNRATDRTRVKRRTQERKAQKLVAG
jgi:ribosome-associated translation inhibitor RaiA